VVETDRYRITQRRAFLAVALNHIVIAMPTDPAEAVS
jgi:hypothetical protein